MELMLWEKTELEISIWELVTWREGRERLRTDHGEYLFLEYEDDEVPAI